MSKNKSAYSVFIIAPVFIVISLAVIIVLRIIFPDFPSYLRILRIFSVPWRITRGLIDFIILFPALAFSGMVIPFGLQNPPPDKFSGFSSKFLEIIKGHILFAIIASAVYGLLSLLALPLLMNYQGSVTYESQLYEASRKAARESVNIDDWHEAARYIAICENIWPNSDELESLRDTVRLGLDDLEMAGAAETRRENGDDPWDTLGVPGQWAPVDASQAYSMAQQAFREEKYYNAHWLATLAARLSRDGSAEKAAIELFAAQAWNKIDSLEPNSREIQTFALFQRKQDGYNAMVSGDWIRAYYIFQDLIPLTPNDTELQNFFAMTKEGVEKTAFFLDEMNMDIGELQTGAVFSLPVTKNNASASGRMILRMDALSTFPDYSYGTKIEILSFNSSGAIAYRLQAPYGKIIPLNLNADDGTAGTRGRTTRQSVLLMNALDRNDKHAGLIPESTGPEKPAGSQLILDVTYDDFLVLSQVRRGLEGLSVQDLFEGIQRLGAYGYIPEVFEAEILNRFAEPIIFLPMAILVIILGWRFRAIKRPRYMIIPMTAVLPVVFAGVTAFYRSVTNTVGISLVLSMGFTAALLTFFGISFVFFVIVLIVLAGQHA